MCAQEVPPSDLLLHQHGTETVRVYDGFSGSRGSFVGASYSQQNFLLFGETTTLSAELGTRQRGAEIRVVKPALGTKPIEIAFTAYARGFNFDQARDPSILGRVFSGDGKIDLFRSYNPHDLLSYRSHSRGITASAQYSFHRTSTRVGVEYSLDASEYRPRNLGTQTFFFLTPVQQRSLPYQECCIPNDLSNVITSSIRPSFTYSTLDKQDAPTRGVEFSAAVAIAGPSGDVNTVEPMIRARYYHSGFGRGQVIAARLVGRMITSYGGVGLPPFQRYLGGGPDEIRGFDSWAISPVAYYPAAASAQVFNDDGTPRTVVVRGPDGTITRVNVTMGIPAYRPFTVGGDEKIFANFEYRIPLVGPLTVVPFTDAGINRVISREKLGLNPAYVDGLNRQFPEASVSSLPLIQPGGQGIRVSSGVELRVSVPRIHLPVRLIGAANPAAFHGGLTTPTVIDRAFFPNNATYLNAKQEFGSPVRFTEPRFAVRLVIGGSF